MTPIETLCAVVRQHLIDNYPELQVVGTTPIGGDDDHMLAYDRNLQVNFYAAYAISIHLCNLDFDTALEIRTPRGSPTKLDYSDPNFLSTLDKLITGRINYVKVMISPANTVEVDQPYWISKDHRHYGADRPDARPHIGPPCHTPAPTAPGASTPPPAPRPLHRHLHQLPRQRHPRHALPPRRPTARD